ncbi:Uncharacterised protein [Mycobacteroides abscessus subsp. abscessus]|nr:Uncharacterised protein [Mycobacteroides abscessus subsp. abscessus]
MSSVMRGSGDVPELRNTLELLVHDLVGGTAVPVMVSWPFR